MSIISPQSWITLTATHALLIVALLSITHFYNHLCMAIQQFTLGHSVCEETKEQEHSE